AARSDGEASFPDEADADVETGANEGVGERAARAGRAALGSVGPVLSSVGARARGAMSSIVAAVQKRRAERADTLRREVAPRRMTAPPPGGALKADGRRLVREGGAEE